MCDWGIMAWIKEWKGNVDWEYFAFTVWQKQKCASLFVIVWSQLSGCIVLIPKHSKHDVWVCYCHAWEISFVVSFNHLLIVVILFLLTLKWPRHLDGGFFRTRPWATSLGLDSLVTRNQLVCCPSKRRLNKPCWHNPVIIHPETRKQP